MQCRWPLIALPHRRLMMHPKMWMRWNLRLQIAGNIHTHIQQKWRLHHRIILCAWCRSRAKLDPTTRRQTIHIVAIISRIFVCDVALYLQHSKVVNMAQAWYIHTSTYLDAVHISRNRSSPSKRKRYYFLLNKLNNSMCISENIQCHVLIYVIVIRCISIRFN